MKHITYFQNFLSNEVDLNKTRLDRLKRQFFGCEHVSEFKPGCLRKD